MKATPISSIGAALVLVVSASGCASRTPPAHEATGPRAHAEIAPGTYELWIDQRCRREARRFSHLVEDDYVRIESEKRFVVFRGTGQRLVLRSVEVPGMELEAIPSESTPGTWSITSASGGLLTVREGPREKRAELVLFGTGRPYLACDRGALRTVASR